jgi:hypothetical protein
MTIMPELLANIYTSLIVAGPLGAGIIIALLIYSKTEEIFFALVGGIVAALIVGFVLGPRHRAEHPEAYEPIQGLGERGGGINNRGQ